ncbi:trichohyalin [Conger conger]|uniref:trichohyalin n=1 Tax=Conger conger TaxID=82655 RepID=UPI002A5AA64D|nr:trichohyalin [Conger conger]XP_061073773.1 trichohyalin [Conger conger]
MGTKRPNWTSSTLQVSDQNASESSRQRREYTGRDTSPRTGTKALGERERESNREEEWRREKEMERMRARKWDGEREMAQGFSERERDRYRDRDRDRDRDRGRGKAATAPSGREGERERRPREVRREGMNGKGIVAEGKQDGREREGERVMGGTFPRTRKTSRERGERMGRVVENETERQMMKWFERQKALEMEDYEREKRRNRDLQRDGERDLKQSAERYREIEKDRLRERKRNGGEQREKDGDRWRENEFDPRFRERRREEWDAKELRSQKNRGMDCEREKLKPRQREKEVEFNLPQRSRIAEKERDNLSDRGGKEKEWLKVGWRDTKSDGDSDGERGKGSGRESEKSMLSHKHSKSEGDSGGERKRGKRKEKDDYREAERYREREREFQVGKYREMDRQGEREKERELVKYREKERQREREGERELVKPRDGVRQREWERDAERGRDRGTEREREMDRYRDRDWERKEDKGRQGRTRGETSKNSETQTPNTTGRAAEEEKVREREWYPDRKTEEKCLRFKEKQRMREVEDTGERESIRGSELLKEKLMKVHCGEELKSDGDVERRGEADSKAERIREKEVEREGKLQGGQESVREQEVPDHRHTPRKYWLEPRKATGNTEVDKHAEVEKAVDGHSGRLDRGEGKSLQHMEEEEGVRVDSDKEEGSERDKQTRAQFYEHGEAESLSDGESEQARQSDGCTERETVTDSTEDRDMDRGCSSDLHSDGESQRELDEERERVLSWEDGFITVSSGGEEEEENEEDEFEDCKEFWEGEKEEINDQEESLDEDRQKDSLNTETGRETPVDTKEEENEDEIPSKVTVFCVIGQTLPRTRGHGEIQDKTGEISQNVGHDIGEGPGVTNAGPLDGETGDTKWEKEDQDVESEQPDKEKETAEGSEEKEDEICTLKEERSEENPGIQVGEIPAERNAPEEHLREEVADACPRNGGKEDGGNMMTAESETETENCQEKQDAKETKPHSQMKTACSEERELGRKGTESYSATKEGDKIVSEPIIQTPSDLRTAEERRKEDSAPYIKWAKNVVREILGSSEDNTLEGMESPQNRGISPGLPQTNQETDGEKGSPIYATVNKKTDAEVFTNSPTENEGDMPVYAQIQKKRDRHTDSLAGSETGMHMQMDRQRDTESYTNTHIQIQMGSEPAGQTGTGDGGKADTEEDPYYYVSSPKVPLSKSNSCPSPDKSPNVSIIEKELSNVGNEECKKKGVTGLMVSTSSFRDQGNKARERRKGFRKTTKRGKDEEAEEETEEGEGRDRRTRVFDVSSEGEDYDKLSQSCSEVELRNMTDTIGKMKKRNSKFFNSQLYQQYSEVAQNREIMRQCRNDTLSVCEELPPHSSGSPVPSPPPARRPLPPLPPVPHPHSLAHSSSFSNTSALSLPLPLLPRPPSPNLPRPLSKSPTLWQDLPGVRTSQEFSELSDDERRLQEVRFEVVTSEASYCRSLEIVVEHFVKSKELGSLVTTQDRNWLFSRLGDVRAISHSFLGKLEERVEKDILHFSVCDIIVQHCPRFRLVYVPYLTNQSYQDATYQKLMEECQGFRRVVEKLERNPICQRLPLRSFLILPFQRITRLKLLVQNIVKRITPDTEEEAQAIKALMLLEKLIQEGNDSITQMKSIESLVCLSAKVDFECKTLPLVSQSRRLVREGAVTELRDKKKSERTLYLHLFNDYLLLSLRKEGGRFMVINHAPVSELRVEICRVKIHSQQENVFCLHVSHKPMLLRTDEQSDKLRWMSALSHPHPQIDFTAAQDFTQVQCIRPFTALQPDELNLEKADVLLVHQQSTDGWIEGTRLSDRQRGWAPESHLETITSARARQRNLLDTHKITTITATY